MAGTEVRQLRHGRVAPLHAGSSLAPARAPQPCGADEVTATARFVWLWTSGCCSGVTDDERRARVHAEQAAVSGDRKARLELVALGTGRELEPVYVPTGIGYDATMLGDRVTWMPTVTTVT